MSLFNTDIKILGYYMNNFYVVESPLQALCALELALSKKNETHGIIVRISGGKRTRNDEQILSIINKLKWDYLYLMNNSKYQLSYLDHLNIIRVLRRTRKKFENKVNKLYIGEFRSSFMHMIRCAVNAKEECLLDDGTVTVEMVNKYLSQGFFYPYDIIFPENKYKYILFKIIYYGFNKENKLNKRLKIHTVYKNINYDNIDFVSFTCVKKFFALNRCVDKSLVYFYGSKYSEAKITSLEYELSFLKKVAVFYENKKLVYFAHRDESKIKLEIIKNELGFEVCIPEKTAEIFLLESKVLPVEISSACSSVLVNSSIIFPEIKLRSFRIDSNQVAENARSGINMAYDYFESIDIPIID